MKTSGVVPRVAVGAGRWWSRAIGARWSVLAALCLGTFSSISFKAMAPIALPDIQRDLSANLEQLQWVLNAYTLMLAALALAGGALADFFGRRRLFLTGLCVFLLGAVACALAPSATVLDFTTGWFGLGAGLIAAPGVALVNEAFPGGQRAVAFGAFGATVATATASGPIVGGVVVQVFGWRSIFVVCAGLVMGALLITVTRTNAPVDQVSPAGRFDWGGLLAFLIAIFALNFALIRGNALGFGSATIVTMFALTALALAGLVAVEVIAARPESSCEPILRLQLFRIPSFSGSVLAALAWSFVGLGLTFYMALYIAKVLRNAPIETGLKFLPLTAVGVLAAPLASRLMRWISPRYLIAACLALVAAGCLMLHGLSVSSGWTRLIAGFLVIGVGTGGIVPPLVATAAGVVAPEKTGVSVGVNNTGRNVGLGLGVAGLGALLQSHISARLAHLPGGHGSALAPLVASGALHHAPAVVPPAVRQAYAAVAPGALISGLNELFVVMAVVAVAGAIASLVLVRERDFVIHPAGLTFDRVGEAAAPAAPAPRGAGSGGGRPRGR